MPKYALTSCLLRSLIVAVLFLQLWQSLASVRAAAPEPSMSGAPNGLTCEAMVEPLGIGVTQPRLSWRVNDARTGALQKAYEIRVAGSLEKLGQGQADVWDTGKTDSNESVNVAYAGPALLSRRRYYWQVRVWDADGRPSEYSKASWWEMGLLSPEDWTAKWITRDMPVQRGDYESNPKWIWAADGDALSKATVGKREFRLSFTLSQKPKNAVLLITGKDNIAVWCNGNSVLEASPMSKFGRPRDPWGTFHEITVSNLDTGKNSIAAEVTVDKPERPKAPVQAGFIAMLRVEMPDGAIQRITSNTDWKTIEAQSDVNWTAKGFDDTAWPNAGIAAEI
jgi:alpha-L-rhamnosidase